MVNEKLAVAEVILFPSEAKWIQESWYRCVHCSHLEIFHVLSPYERCLVEECECSGREERSGDTGHQD